MAAVFKPSPGESAGKHFATSSAVERRFKVQKLSSTEDTASLVKAVLDDNSDDVPEELRCPICLGLYLEEIFMCGSGHPICKTCLGKITTEQCPQCRGRMRLGDPLGRNWPLENLLDKALMVCPFRSKGCTEILSRQKMRLHKNDCIFDTENVMQICQHFYKGQHCAFRINRKNPTEALEHFRYFHRTSCFSNTMETEGQILTISFTHKDLQENINYPKIYSLGSGTNQRNFLIVLNVNSEIDHVNFFAINLNEATAPRGEMETDLNFKVIDSRPEKRFTIPVIAFENAPKILEEKRMELCFVKSSVKEYCSKWGGHSILRICYETLVVD